MCFPLGIWLLVTTSILSNYLFDHVFLFWSIGFLLFFIVLVIWGILALFRKPLLHERIWTWIALAINLFAVYSFTFAQLHYA